MAPKSLARCCCAAWHREYCSLAILLVCCASLVGLLWCYNGSKSPEFRFGFSLHSLVTVPSRIAEAQIFTIDWAVLNQLGLLNHITPAKLKELEIFYGAASSVTGVPALFWLHRFRGFASLAALLVILRLGITITVQNAVSQHEELVHAGTRSVPICQRWSTSTTNPGSPVQDVDNPTINAFFEGVYGNGGSSIRGDCAGANKCVWNNFSSLIVLSRCEDISSSIRRQCENGSSEVCNLTIPTTNFTMNIAINRYQSQAFLPQSFFPKVPWYFSASQMIMVPPSTTNRDPIAVQCILYPAVATLTAEFRNGSYTETVVSTWHNTSGIPSPGSEDPDWLLNPPGSPLGTFSINGSNNVIPAQNTLIDIFTGEGRISLNGTYFSKQYWHQRLYSSGSAEAYIQIIVNAASSLSDMLRSSKPTDRLHDYLTPPATQAIGQAYENQSIIRIYWQWLALLWFVTTLAAINLGSVYFKSARANLALFKGRLLDWLDIAPKDAPREQMERVTGSNNHENATDHLFVLDQSVIDPRLRILTDVELDELDGQH